MFTPDTKLLILDTETSGLPNFKLDADHPDQPRLATAAMIVLDGIYAEPREFGFMVKPDGWSMDPGATAVNGLTDEMLHAGGSPVEEVLDFYTAKIRQGYVVVAHNAQFDCKIMRGELRRAKRDDLFMITRNVCTMRSATDVCQLPAANGRRGFKFPKLVEACKHFELEQEAAHTAMGDARDAMRVMIKLYELGALIAPQVHLKKEQA